MDIQKDYSNKLCNKADDNLTSKPLCSTKTSTFTELFEEVIKMIGTNQNITLTLNEFHRYLKRAYDRGYANAVDLYKIPTSPPDTSQTPQTPATDQPAVPAIEPNKPKTPDYPNYPNITWPWEWPPQPLKCPNTTLWFPPNVVYCDPNTSYTTTLTSSFTPNQSAAH